MPSLQPQLAVPDASEALMEPIRLVMEFARARKAGDPHAFHFAPQEYLLRSAGGGFKSAQLPWDESLLLDLAAVRQPARDPAVVQRLGETLRAFVEPIGWAQYEAELTQAESQQRQVVLTIRSAAAELYALPWELCTLPASGRHLGELPHVLLRYEWPETASVSEQPAPRAQGGRILLAWSAAAGSVPATEHQQAIERACQAGFHPFDADSDVLPHASLGRLADALDAARRHGPPIAVLHLLCHGSAVGTTFGLALDGDSPGEATVVVDAGRLRQLLAPHAAMLRLVVLAACDGGNPGALANQLGSAAQTLHRAGIQAVVASRYPLSAAGSIRLANKIYDRLLAGPRSLESALLAARADLFREAGQLDWASLQLYARASDGDDTRPVVFRPYRGLLAFHGEHHRFFFGRDAEIAAIVQALQALPASSRPRFLVVAGASGTGKSSVVLGGAVPLLQRDPRQSPRLLYMRPGSEPQAALEMALAERADTSTPALLVVDQFEELFTHTADSRLRQAFAQRLWQLAGQAELGLFVLLTLRVDFIGRCGELILDENGRRLDQVAYDEAHRVFLAQLGPSQIRALIEQPARQVGLRLEAGLADQMVEEVGSEPGALPLLEDTLDLLWQRREGNTLTQRAYVAIGGVTGALQGRADALIDQMSAAEQRVARRLLVRMVSVAEDAALATRRRITIDKLRPSDAAEGQSFDKVLATLVEARLLVRDGQGQAQTVEVAHEALIRKWQRLSSWVQADRTMLAELEKVARWAAQWKELGTLLSGNQLGYAAEVEKRYHDDFPADARALLAASQAQAEVERRRAQRNRQRTRLAAAFFAMLATVLAGLGAWALRERRQSHQRLIQLYEEQGRQELLRGNPTRALAYLSEASKEGMTDPALPYLLGQATSAVEGRVLKLPVKTGRWVEAPWFAGGTPRRFTWGDGTVQLWDLASGKPVQTLKHSSRPEHAAVSPDGRQILLSMFAPIRAEVWDARSGAMLYSIQDHSEPIRDASFSPDGTRFVTASSDGTAKLWDSQTGRLLSTLACHKDEILSARFSPTGELLATASADKVVRIWDPRDGRLVQSLNAPNECTPRPPSSPLRLFSGEQAAIASFSPEGARVLTTFHRDTAELWDSATGKQLVSFKGHSGATTRASFSRDGTRILTVGTDRVVKIWDAYSGVLISSLQGHTAVVRSATFSSDGAYVLTASDDRTARVWDVDSGAVLATLGGHDSAVVAATFSPDDRQIVTLSKELVAKAWDIGKGRLLREFIVSERQKRMGITSAADGTRLIVSNLNHTVQIWDTLKGRLVSSLRTDSEPAPVASMMPLAWQHVAELSHDGRLLVAPGTDGNARVWDAATGEVVSTLAADGATVSCARFSQDDARVATAHKDRTIRVWEARTGKLLATLTGHSDSVAAIDFSRDGEYVATAGHDQTIGIWHVSKTTTLLSFPAHADHITSVVYSPDGSKVASASWDGMAKVWDARTGKLLVQLSGHTGWVTSVAFNPDGNRVVTAGADGTNKVWDAQDGRLLASLAGGDAAAFFGADGASVVSLGTNPYRLQVWALPTDRRSSRELATLLRCQTGVHLENGIPMEGEPDWASCAAVQAVHPAADRQLYARALRARNLRVSGQRAASHGLLDIAQAHYEEAMSIYRDLEDEVGAGMTQVALGELAVLREQPQQAAAQWTAAAALFRRVNHPDEAARTLLLLGDAALAAGRFQEARPAYEEAFLLTQGLKPSEHGLITDIVTRCRSSRWEKDDDVSPDSRSAKLFLRLGAAFWQQEAAGKRNAASAPWAQCTRQVCLQGLSKSEWRRTETLSAEAQSRPCATLAASYKLPPAIVDLFTALEAR